MDKKEQKNLENLRERLYSRSDGPKKRKPYKLEDEPVDLRKSWRDQTAQRTSATAVIPDQPAPEAPVTPVQTTASVSLRRRYRWRLVLVGLAFFVVSIIASSLFILWGGNSISGENISISINGPFTLGGGQTIPLQIGITNQNSVPIESATLLVEYPLGTQSVSEVGKELFSERLPISNIAAGETVNIPLQAQVFGEENEEQMIRASVEYRVEGSNATFYKEADPLRFKISSSPVVIQVEAASNLAVGQETDIEVTIISNSPNPLNDILMRAEYPTGFEFTESEPATASGQNVWNISELEPEENVTINITGQFFGTETEERTINFTVGVPNERDRFNLASVFATASTDFVLVTPAANIDFIVDGRRGSTAAIEPGQSASLSVEVTNTHTRTLYDVVVSLDLSGSALANSVIKTNNGYYDSNTSRIIWDVSRIPGLGTFQSGDSQTLSFSIEPNVGSLLTPQINLKATVQARSTADSRATEEVGTASADLRIKSETSLQSEALRDSGPFSDFGPVPPEIGETTSYTIEFGIKNGSNSIADTVMVANLPSYVNWLGNTSGDGDWSYNPATRSVEWEVGDLSSEAEATGAFQVSILPSASQVGTTPTLVGEQLLRATDRFTGSDVQAASGAVTTSVGSGGSGVVIPN